MRRAATSWLLSKANGCSPSSHIGNPSPGTQKTFCRCLTLIREGKEQRLPLSSKRPLAYSVSINGRPNYGACMYPYTLRSFSTRFLSVNGRANTLRSFSTRWGSNTQTSTYTFQDSERNSQATLKYLVALVIAMVGCSYAAVPLYRKFCQATGYGGTVRRRETVEEKIARHGQEGVAATRSRFNF